jgi:hypothetical protein
MRRNCFDHVLDIAEQPTTTYWIKKNASFNIVAPRNSSDLSGILRPFAPFFAAMVFSNFIYDVIM